MQILSELLSYAFRPFFLLGALCAITVMALWTLALAGIGPVAAHANPALWHAHEMLFGFAMAIIAGFIMTAVAMWTGRARLHGAPLGVMVAAWIAGRGVMAVAGTLPEPLVAVVDMLFPLSLVFFFAREVIAADNRRNYVIVGIVVAMSVLNLVYHSGVIFGPAGLDRTALLLMIHVVLVLIAAIAGRIVPSFTANWLRGQGREPGRDRFPVSTNGVEVASLVLTLVTGFGATFAPMSLLTGVAAVAAFAVHLFRLSRWTGLSTFSEPLLFALHVAYAWIPIGYLLIAWSAFGSVSGSAYSASVALHALTMGAIGSMILAMTTRVSLGHTGRALHATRLTVVAYFLLTIAVVVRLLGPFAGAQYLRTVEIAAGSWIFAFAIFVWVYWPILTGPRAD